MIKVALITFSYYSRAIYRKFSKKSGYKIVGFFDNDRKKDGQLFDGVGVYHLSKIKEYEFDIVMIAGRYNNLLNKQLQESFLIPKSKIKILNKQQILASDNEIKLREEDLICLLNSTVKYLYDLGMHFWIDHSGLLAICREQKLAEMSDVDFSCYGEDLKLIHQELMKLENVNLKITTYKSKSDSVVNKMDDIVSIRITSLRYKQYHVEPAVIDFKAKYIYGDSIIWDHKSGWFEVEKSFLDKITNINYGGVNVLAPYKSSEYLKKLYGADWKVKALSWNEPKASLTFS